MYPSAFVLFLPSSTALFLFIEMSYMLPPFIKYYRSTLWGENTPALLKQQNLYFSPSFRTSVLTWVSGWSVRVHWARTLVSDQGASAEGKESHIDSPLLPTANVRQSSWDSSIGRPASQGFRPWLFLVYSSLPYGVTKDYLPRRYLLSRLLTCDSRGDEQPGRCWVEPWGLSAWHGWWKATAFLSQAAAPASPTASGVERDGVAQLSGGKLDLGRKM